MPGLRTLALTVAVRGGAKWETEDTSGWSHCLEHLVFKDGRYSTRPNNHLYSKLVFKLVAMHKNGIRFSQDHLPSVHTMDLVKSLQKSIAPNKPLIIRPKPKRKNAPL